MGCPSGAYSGQAFLHELYQVAHIIGKVTKVQRRLCPFLGVTQRVTGNTIISEPQDGGWSHVLLGPGDLPTLSQGSTVPRNRAWGTQLHATLAGPNTAARTLVVPRSLHLRLGLTVSTS